MTIISTIISIVGALLLLCVLVFVHELGHFLAGKAFGFGIKEFAIGFGPKVGSRVGKDGICYSLRALPLGGFCAFYGEDQEDDDPRALTNQKAWKRFIMLLAGPVMNILFALLLSIIVLNVYGDYAPVVQQVEENSPAHTAGLEVGDVILSVNEKIVTADTIVGKIKKADSSAVRLGIMRGEQETEVVLQDIFDATAGTNRMGIAYSPTQRRSFTFGQAITASFEFTVFFIKELLNVFGSMVAQPSTISSQVSGPVGTIAVIGESLRYGMEVILRMAILISVNLGVFNLLPLPALDGGRLIFSGIEMIFRKPVPQRVESAIHMAGFVFLMLFVVYVTFGDITRMFQSGP